MTNPVVQFSKKYCAKGLASPKVEHHGIYIAVCTHKRMRLQRRGPPEVSHRSEDLNFSPVGKVT
jgi:hypothetical protein